MSYDFSSCDSEWTTTATAKSILNHSTRHGRPLCSDSIVCCITTDNSFVYTWIYTRQLVTVGDFFNVVEPHAKFRYWFAKRKINRCEKNKQQAKPQQACVVYVHEKQQQQRYEKTTFIGITMRIKKTWSKNNLKDQGRWNTKQSMVLCRVGVYPVPTHFRWTVFNK